MTDQYEQDLVTRATFGRIAGVTRHAVTQAISRGLLDAAAVAKRVDPLHFVALRYLARHPLPAEQTKELDPDSLSLPWLTRYRGRLPTTDDLPPGYLAPACVGDKVDVDHPRARSFLALAWGHLPTDAEIEAGITKDDLDGSNGG